MTRNEWYELAKSFEEQASEIERGVHGNTGHNPEREIMMRDIAGALFKMAHKQETPFRVVKGEGE